MLSPTNFQSFIHSNVFCIVQFGSEKCAPCHAIWNKLQMWNRIPTAYFEADDYISFCAQNGIFTVPTLCFYYEGKLQHKVSGYFSLDEFLATIEKGLS